MSNKLPSRVLPPNYKFVIELPAMSKRLTWKQRLQVAVGYNFIFGGTILCEHSPGKIAPEFHVKTTRELIPDQVAPERKP